MDIIEFSPIFVDYACSIRDLLSQYNDSMIWMPDEWAVFTGENIVYPVKHSLIQKKNRIIDPSFNLTTIKRIPVLISDPLILGIIDAESQLKQIELSPGDAHSTLTFGSSVPIEHLENPVIGLCLEVPSPTKSVICLSKSGAERQIHRMNRNFKGVPFYQYLAFRDEC